ncbi:MAG: hypothetical protein M3Y87_05300 [Myxococcota bacterium]|nr:hypothetical protein [Myxococcota bacterium]
MTDEVGALEARLRPGSSAGLPPWARGVGGGCLTALVAIGLAFGITLWSVLGLGEAAAESAGQIVGCFAVPLIGGSGLAGIAWSRRPLLGAIASACIVALALAGALGLSFVIGRASAGGPSAAFLPLEPAERAPMASVERGAIWWTQAALGLELLAPVGLVPFEDSARDARAAAIAARGGELGGWTWASPDGARVLRVLVVRTTAHEPGDVRELLDGLPVGTRRELEAAGYTVQVDERRGPDEHRLTASHPTLGPVSARFLLSRRPDSTLSVTITAGGPEGAELERVVESATLRATR